MMKRLFAMLAGLGFIVAAAVPASAAIDVYEFKNVEQEQAFQELTATLRCPKCQNNTIADSNATLAQDMRQKTFELLNEGKSQQDVIDYMVARYGNFVTYDPPLMASTLILWLGPILFIIIGFTILVMRSRKTEDAKCKVTLEAEEEQRLQALLEEIEQQNPNENGKVK
ncbi:cytochrome c-type biogenesis protein [Photobacterium lipolyticum]|uniref:Cytochrome c-type biogenesis protein n=1 Tax=Photobacterium lipolyticum TaxID=266810 RepID=A0A2T3N561_9GAMM|nr:cytochrome c-type biogenesis protein [Photobacterium lipolyticum]PSW07564.1 cytochrome c-type biogenesis protein CcmH [Photobacterium lipolyticum]